MIKEVFRPNEEIKIEHPDRHFEPFKSGATSHRGIILSLLIKFNKDAERGINYSALELKQVWSEALTKYGEIQKNTKATVKLKGWKGVSGINVIEQPNSFKVIMFQKDDQDSDAKEIERTITKEELNQVIGAINLLNKDNNKIPTPEIAEQFCKLRNIKYNNQEKDLFHPEFDWQLFFGDRFLHTQLNICLRVLDYYEVIKYRGGKSQVLKKVLDIQTEL